MMILLLQLVGSLLFSSLDACDTRTRNCVNYSDVMYAGDSFITAICGVMGVLLNSGLSTPYMNNIMNCANYGTLVHNGTSKNMLIVVGIISTNVHSKIENCINFGTMPTVKESVVIGMISGGLNTQTTINYCFWVAKESIGKPYGFMLISEPIVKDSYLVQSNETTLRALNNWATANGHTEWMPSTQTVAQ